MRVSFGPIPKNFKQMLPLILIYGTYRRVRRAVVSRWRKR